MNATIIINGHTEYDGPFDTWQAQPPATIRNHLTPGTPTTPGMKELMIALVEAALRQRNIRADLTTRPDGWTLTVIEETS